MDEPGQARSNCVRYFFEQSLSRHHLLEVLVLVKGSRDRGTTKIDVTEEVKEAGYVLDGKLYLSPLKSRLLRRLTISTRLLDLLAITDTTGKRCDPAVIEHKVHGHVEPVHAVVVDLLVNLRTS